MVKKNVSNSSTNITTIFNETHKSSISTLKRIGDKIPPCLTPLETLKGEEKLLLDIPT